jgi:hypothetical protein
VKAKYKILYKNGVQDEMVQEATEVELSEINKTVLEAFSGDREGFLTFGDGMKEGRFIRLSDVSRVSIEVIND